jgi:hypothetical protein
MKIAWPAASLSEMIHSPSPTIRDFSPAGSGVRRSSVLVSPCRLSDVPVTQLAKSVRLQRSKHGDLASGSHLDQFLHAMGESQQTAKLLSVLYVSVLCYRSGAQRELRFGQNLIEQNAPVPA